MSQASDNIPLIPQYRLLREIGLGRYGHVYLAQDTLGAYRAIKIVRRELLGERPYERELHGLKLFADVSRQHEGLVDILHVGRNDEEHYFYYVMELADPVESFDPNSYAPRTLESELDRRHSIPAMECVRIGLALSSALTFMHRQGLVHRDIKPANVIFVQGTPRLADIGLVSEIETEGSPIGTLHYMDQATHGTVLGDIFSLGRMLYQMATGLPPKRFPSPPALSKPDPAFLELNEVLLRAGVQDPKLRYPSMDAVLAHLALLQAGESLRTAMRMRRWWRLVRRHWGWAVVLFVLSTLAILQTVMQALQARELRERRVGSYLAYGTRAVNGQDYLEALPWFAASLELESRNAQRSTNHALRIGSALASSPRLVRVWSASGNTFQPEFTPDGRQVMAADSNGIPVMWDIQTGQCVPGYLAGDKPCDVALMSPDGRLIFTANTDGTGDLWNLKEGKHFHFSKENNPPIKVLVAFTPDSSTLLTADPEGGPVYFLNCATGSEICKLQQSAFHLQHLAVDKKGEFLAISTQTNGVAVFRLKTGDLVSTFTNHSSWIFSSDFSPRSLDVISGSYDRTARLWNRTTGQQSLLLRHGGGVGIVKFSPQGDRIVTTSTDNLARIINADTGDPIGPPLPHESMVTSASFSPAGDLLLTHTLSGTVRVWALNEAVHWSATNLSASLSSDLLAWSEDAQIVTASHESGSRHRWNTGKVSLGLLLRPSQGDRTLSFSSRIESPEGPIRHVSLWNITEGRRLSPSFSVPWGYDQWQINSDGSLLAGAGEHRIAVWDTALGQQIVDAEIPPGEVSCIVWHPESDQFAISVSTNILLYNIPKKQFAWPAIKLPMNVAKLCFSPNGRLLASACSNNTLDPGEARVWDVLTGAPRTPRLLHKDGVLDVQISPNGQWLATGSEDFTARIWDLQTGRAAGRELRHPNEVASVNFNDHGNWLVTACRDGTGRVWDLETSEPLTPAVRFGERLASAQFGPDNSVICVTGDGQRWLWRLPFDHRPVDQIKRWARLLSAERSGPSEGLSFQPLVSYQAEFEALSALSHDSRIVVVGSAK